MFILVSGRSIYRPEANKEGDNIHDVAVEEHVDEDRVTKDDEDNGVMVLLDLVDILKCANG